MFKNVTVYRIAPGWSVDLGAIEAALQKGCFVECSPSQEQSAGWTPPRGEAHAPLVESVGGQLLLRWQTEKKVLPGSVVKRRVEELAQRIEAESGFKPGRKQTKELREQAVLELLPMAFTRQSALAVWLDPAQRTLVVGSSSQSRADEVASALVKALDGLAVRLLQTTSSASAAMSEWLASREAPAGFSVDRECELKSSDETRSVVRYARHTLDIDEVGQHIAQGKLPTQLAMTWSDRISFVLTDTLQIKKLNFLDVVFDGASPAGDDGFDADAAIATGEISRLLPDLIDALGGEAVPG